MLKKLMKHDFRALSRTLFPLQVGILGGGLVATLLTALTIRLGEHTATEGGSALLRQLMPASARSSSCSPMITRSSKSGIGWSAMG